MLGNYRKLKVWKSSMQFTSDIYRLTRDFPENERFGLSSQLQRASVSVPSNIAEGFGRQHTRELIQFLYHSRGSLQEVLTQVEIARNLDYMSKDTLEQIIERGDEIQKMLNGLIYSLKNKDQ